MKTRLLIWVSKLERDKHFKIIPNIITITRFILTIIFIILCLNTKLYLYILLTFILICISDITDGKIARHFNCSTKLGSVLDVLMDALFIFSSLSILCFKEHIVPLWFILVVLINFLTFIITSSITKKLYINTKNFFVFDLIGRISSILFYIIPGITYCIIFFNSDLKILIESIIALNTVLALITCISRIIRLYKKKNLLQ